MYKEAMKLNISSNELFSFRDDDGYIILDKYITDFLKESRERVGNPNRIKNWIETSDGKYYMIKTNALLYDQKNYTNLAEIICMEIARKNNIKYAKYDVIKFKGEVGIITELMIEYDEYLVTLEDFIVSQEHPDNPEIIDFLDTINSLEKNLKYYGYDEEDIEKIMIELKKELVFDLIVGATDRHAENISLILNRKNNRIRLAPIYDTENSLLLENNEGLVKQLSLDVTSCSFISSGIIPKIAQVPFKTAQAEEISLYTFELLLQDEEIEDFAWKILDNLNIDEILNKIGKSITIPFEVKRVASVCVKNRINELNKILYVLKVIRFDLEYMKECREKIKRRRSGNNEI